MSYSKTYRKKIVIPYRGSVNYSYPASSTGGSGSAPFSGTVSEDVVVNINVDTVPFDASVDACVRQVDGLTGSVVATETAQVASIIQKGRRIGRTIVDGFFNTVDFEISTQIVEIQKRVESLLLDLNEKQKRLAAFRKQMEKDYHRTAERYMSVFGDLDKELDNRIHAIDQQVFGSADEMYRAEDRFMETDMLNISSLASKESAILGAQICTALAKDHAFKALNESNTFLAKKAATEQTLSHCKLDDSRNRKFYAPVCCSLCVKSEKQQEVNCFASELFSPSVREKVAEKAGETDFDNLSEEDKKNVDVFFHNILNEFNAVDERTARIKSLISKLYSK